MSLNLDQLNDVEKDFLVSEYNQINSYLVSVEKSMIDLLKLYNSVLAIMVPVSAAIFKLFRHPTSYWFSGTLGLVFFILGLYILAMYVELRIRKIKTLEQIAVFREKFITANPSIFREFLRMITSIKACPPYLRRPSSEWYTVVYIAFLNGVAFGVSIFSFLMLLSDFLCFDGFGKLKRLVFATVSFVALYFTGMRLFIWSTAYCHRYDLKREKEYGVENEYSFLSPYPYFPWLFKGLRKRAEKVEQKVRQEQKNGKRF